MIENRFRWFTSMIVPISLGFACVLTTGSIATTALAEESRQAFFALHPDNPHYFLWRGEPTVLVTSGEHYGAVLNLDFDYVAYLDELQTARTQSHPYLFRRLPRKCRGVQNYGEYARACRWAIHQPLGA